MSRLLEIKDQLKQKSLELFDKIKETEFYQKADEKYQSLSPQGQKIARILSVILITFTFVSYPLSQFQISRSIISEFEIKRELLKDMFKTHRESDITNLMPEAPVTDILIQQIQSSLNSAQLLPQQIISVTAIEPEGHTIQKNIISSVVSVQLNTLNIRQTVDIGTQLANISGSLKVKDLFMTASLEQPGYYDVTYKIYAFNVPKSIAEAPPDSPESPTKKKKIKNDETPAGLVE